MTVEIFDPKFVEKPTKKFVTFELIFRDDETRDVAFGFKGCLYSDGKISPPRIRMPNGFYRDVICFGPKVYHAAMEVLRAQNPPFWEKWPVDAPSPYDPSKTFVGKL